MNSMTGFGRGEAQAGGRIFTVEIKSVNHRYLESNIRMPFSLSALEAPVRARLKERLSRGKVDVFVTYVNHSDEQGNVWVNEAVLRQYVDQLRALAGKYSLEDDLSLSKAAMFPNVLTACESAENVDELQPVLMAALDEALDHLNEMRAKEGDILRQDLSGKADELASCVDQAAEKAPLVPQIYREKLSARISQVLSATQKTELDAGRLEQEVSLYADHCCIDEEITRLRSHLQQMRGLLSKEEPVGRQLDFLVQEMNREANTIASKANDIDITQSALAMKNLIEKIREQVQNIE